MDISAALVAAAEEAEWSATQIAAAAGVTEGAARKWISGQSKPSGEVLLALMAALPGLRKRLGYKAVA